MINKIKYLLGGGLLLSLVSWVSATTGMGAGSTANLAGTGPLVDLGIENVPGVTITQWRIFTIDGYVSL